MPGKVGVESGDSVKFGIVCRGWIFRRQDFSWAPEFAVFRSGRPREAYVAGPGAVRNRLRARNGRACFHFRVEVIEVVQQEPSANIGQFRRAEVVLAVVTDDEVLDHRL